MCDRYCGRCGTDMGLRAGPSQCSIGRLTQGRVVEFMAQMISTEGSRRILPSNSAVGYDGKIASSDLVAIMRGEHHHCHLAVCADNRLVNWCNCTLRIRAPRNCLPHGLPFGLSKNAGDPPDAVRKSVEHVTTLRATPHNSISSFNNKLTRSNRMFPSPSSPSIFSFIKVVRLGDPITNTC